MQQPPATSGHDAPIATREQDFYDRWATATAISQIIEAAPPEWSTRIGLSAPWGDGKTSVLNFLEGQQKTAGNIVIRYAPWGARTPDEAWRDFGASLIDGLKTNGIWPSRWSRTKHFLVRQKARLQAGVGAAGKMAEASGHVPGAAAGGKFASTLLETKLRFTREDIRKLMPKLGARRVVVFIDDLDRTDDVVIPKLLLALRELLDCAQFAFVLAFDHHVIASALEHANPSWADSGASFLDKVIDFKIELPQPTQAQIRRLAHHQFESMCAFVPKEAVETIIPLLPSNPRKLKLLTRTVSSMQKESARHEPDELDWKVILLMSLIRAESDLFAKNLLDATVESEPFDFEEYLADDRDAKKRAEDSKVKVLSESKLSASQRARAEILLKAWMKAVPTVPGERLRYQAMFALAPHSITWAEFKEFASRWRLAKKAEAISEFIGQRASATGSRIEVVGEEFAETVVSYYAMVLERASEIQSDAGHRKLTEEASDMLDLVMQSFTSKPSLIPADSKDLMKRWEILRDVALRWRHFDSNTGEPALRAKEVDALVAIGRAVHSPIAIYEKVHPGVRVHSVFGKREMDLKKAMFEQVRSSFELGAVEAALALIARPGAIEDVQRSDASGGEKYLVASPKSPLYRAFKPRLLAALHARLSTTNSIEDSHAFLEILLAALDHEGGGMCTVDERKQFIADHPDVFEALWKNCVAEPSQFRMLQSLRGLRDTMIGAGMDVGALPTPVWLEFGLEREDIAK